MQRSIAILLAEPNPLLREKIAGILGRETRIWCVVQVDNEGGLLDGAARVQPDLILVDLTILRDRALAEHLRTEAPSALVYALVDSNSDPYKVAAKRLGLDGLMERSRVAEGVADALQSRIDR